MMSLKDLPCLPKEPVHLSETLEISGRHVPSIQKIGYLYVFQIFTSFQRCEKMPKLQRRTNYFFDETKRIMRTKAFHLRICPRHLHFFRYRMCKIPRTEFDDQPSE